MIADLFDEDVARKAVRRDGGSHKTDTAQERSSGEANREDATWKGMARKAQYGRVRRKECGKTRAE